MTDTGWGWGQRRAWGWGGSPVMMTRAARQEKEGTSTLMRCRLWENSRMASIHSPKPRTHCCRCSTTPLQKMSFPSSGFELAAEIQVSPPGTAQPSPSSVLSQDSPVRQAQDEELQEG